MQISDEHGMLKIENLKNTGIVIESEFSTAAVFLSRISFPRILRERAFRTLSRFYEDIKDNQKHLCSLYKHLFVTRDALQFIH